MKFPALAGCGLLILLGCGLLMSLPGCERSGDRDPWRISLDSLTMENYPKVDGSTSTHPLQTLIACEALGVEWSWMPGWFDETYRIWPSFDEKPEVARFIMDSINHKGTHGAYVNLIGEKADLILVARSASPDELQMADSTGIKLATTAVALDAFVFIANVNNPVASLTVQQIREIYTGQITAWDQVGGNHAEINPYQREPNSGSQELMLSLVMKDLTMPDFPELILYGMMGPIYQITYDRDGLGYTVYFFEQFMAPNDSLKLLGVNGVLPDYATLRNREYIYTTEVYAVIREDLDHSSSAYLLYLWLQTLEGQAAVEESGYIPVSGPAFRD